MPQPKVAECIVKGTLLKFADWKWTKGKESIEIECGTALVALGTTAAWVKWSGGNSLSGTRCVRLVKDCPIATSLAILKGRDWEIGPGQQAQGPLAEHALHLLRRPDQCRSITFSTSSWGGRQAVNDLAEQIRDGYVPGNRARRLWWNSVPSPG